MWQGWHGRTTEPQNRYVCDNVHRIVVVVTPLGVACL